jgi:hypothetical protein
MRSALSGDCSMRGERLVGCTTTVIAEIFHRQLRAGAKGNFATGSSLSQWSRHGQDYAAFRLVLCEAPAISSQAGPSLHAVAKCLEFKLASLGEPQGFRPSVAFRVNVTVILAPVGALCFSRAAYICRTRINLRLLAAGHGDRSATNGEDEGQCGANYLGIHDRCLLCCRHVLPRQYQSWCKQYVNTIYPKHKFYDHLFRISPCRKYAIEVRGYKKIVITICYASPTSSSEAGLYIIILYYYYAVYTVPLVIMGYARTMRMRC